MIQKGTVVYATQAMHGIAVGDKFTVMNVDKNGCIVVTGNGGYGVMSMDEIGKLFAIGGNPKRVWSDWQWDHDELGEYEWRTNGKDVQVELWNGVSAKAHCHPDDVFDEEFGIDLALRRAVYKYYNRVANKFVDKYGADALL